MSATPTPDWQIFKGNNSEPHDDISRLPEAPSWRPFGKDLPANESRRKRRGTTFQTRPEEVKLINAALYLRRPVLITGRPGTGKSSLAYAVAEELKLGEVLYWPITTRSTLKSGLYNYDAIGRLQEVKQREETGTLSATVDDPQQVAKYITLGPLGTALLPSKRPRVLLIDEIDKSDIDLPNDLLTIFEEGRYEIPELLRTEPDTPDGEQPPPVKLVQVRTAYSDKKNERTGCDYKVPLPSGRIACNEFPLVILTSNNERDFPPPFLRRCLRLNMYEPDKLQLEKIIRAHFDDGSLTQDNIDHWIKEFLDKRDAREQLATDQLLNALFMVAKNHGNVGDDLATFLKAFLLSAIDRPLPKPDPDQPPDDLS